MLFTKIKIIYIFFKINNENSNASVSSTGSDKGELSIEVNILDLSYL